MHLVPAPILVHGMFNAMHAMGQLDGLLCVHESPSRQSARVDWLIDLLIPGPGEVSNTSYIRCIVCLQSTVLALTWRCAALTNKYPAGSWTSPGNIFRVVFGSTLPGDRRNAAKPECKLQESLGSTAIHFPFL